MGKKRVFKNDKHKQAFTDWVFNHSRNILKAGNISNYQVVGLSWLGEPTSSAMEVVIDHKYFTIDLRVNRTWAVLKWEKKYYHDLLQTLCHEMAHVVTDEADHKLVFISNSKERSFYFERMTETTSRWLYSYYLRYMKDKPITNIATGK